MVNFVWRERWLNRRCVRSPKKHLFVVWILRCISRLTSLVGVIRDPRYTNSLTILRCSNRPISYRAAITYFVFCLFLFLTLLWLLHSPMLSKHPERLTDSYLRYLYHRHMRVVVFLCCRLCRLFVGLLVVR
jgi:hypothetical protein